MIGSSCNCTLFNCVVQDTVVNITGTNTVSNGGTSGGYIGGLVGAAENTFFEKCFQLGISNNPYYVILFANCLGGGLVGKCCGCSLYQCGVLGGRIDGILNNIGGIAGQFDSPATLSEVYVTSNVNLTGGSDVGGLAGSISITPGMFNVSNCYSQANVSGSFSGGLFGFVDSGPNVTFSSGMKNPKKLLKFKLSNHFSTFKKTVYVDSLSTSLCGIVIGSNDNPKISLSLVFVNNATQKPAFGFLSISRVFSFPNSSCLQNQVKQNFSQCIWDGFRLRSEYNYTASFVFLSLFPYFHFLLLKKNTCLWSNK